MLLGLPLLNKDKYFIYIGFIFISHKHCENEIRINETEKLYDTIASIKWSDEKQLKYSNYNQQNNNSKNNMDISKELIQWIDDGNIWETSDVCN